MGGDGVMTNFLPDLLKESIEISKLSFVSLPFGSGNDMSRVTGWGASPDEPHLSNLYRICLDAAKNSIVTKLNVWDVQIKLSAKRGEIWQVDSTTRNDRSILEKDQFVVNKIMLNYLSVGECSKIGYQFDRNRTSSMCCNG